MSAGKGKKETGRADERRRAKRVIVQDSFSLFLVIPKVHGMSRVYMRDLSRLGVCFHTEMESEFQESQRIHVRLYTNPAFYLPLECRVVRVLHGEVALEFLDPDSKPVQAVTKLLDFLDVAAEAGELGG